MRPTTFDGYRTTENPHTRDRHGVYILAINGLIRRVYFVGQNDAGEAIVELVNS